LVEKTNGSVSIVTTNGSGTESSEQHLPVDPSVLTQSASHEKSRLALENSGDVSCQIFVFTNSTRFSQRC
jgi:hypothetical protein